MLNQTKSCQHNFESKEHDMITFGTVIKISRPGNGYSVICRDALGIEFNCFTKEIGELETGMYVAFGGRETGRTMKDSILKKYMLGESNITDPEYRDLWES